ncbi:MAG: hypothetical protein AAGD13_07690 [Pseudomonadota bacterium]
MLDLDALTLLDDALAELTGEHGEAVDLSPLAQEIARSTPAPRCPHLARIAAE